MVIGVPEGTHAADGVGEGGGLCLAPGAVVGIDATTLAQISIKSMYDASYEGTHWIATYIVDYLVSQQRRPAMTDQR